MRHIESIRLLDNDDLLIDSNKKTKKGGKAAERDQDDGRRKRKISSSDESLLLDQYVSEKKRKRELRLPAMDTEDEDMREEKRKEMIIKRNCKKALLVHAMYTLIIYYTCLLYEHLNNHQLFSLSASLR